MSSYLLLSSKLRQLIGRWLSVSSVQRNTCGLTQSSMPDSGGIITPLPHSIATALLSPFSFYLIPFPLLFPLPPLEIVFCTLLFFIILLCPYLGTRHKQTSSARWQHHHSCRHMSNWYSYLGIGGGWYVVSIGGMPTLGRQVISTLGSYYITLCSCIPCHHWLFLWIHQCVEWGSLILIC
jgi:hypothetical protein